MVRAAVLPLLTACAACGKVEAVRDAVPAEDAGGDDARAGPILDGLVAWYRMDADVGTAGVTSDAIGGHNGSCASGHCPVFIATGKIGGAQVFDGVDDLFRVASAAELEGVQGFTVTAWINRSAATHACIINKSYKAANYNSWQACVSETGELAFYSIADGSEDGQISVVLGTSRWYHIALWWDTKTKATYVDGERVAATDDAPILFDNSDITIGADIDGANLFAPFRGQIDDVRVYNRALSDSEIKALQVP